MTDVSGLHVLTAAAKWNSQKGVRSVISAGTASVTNTNAINVFIRRWTPLKILDVRTKYASGFLRRPPCLKPISYAFMFCLP